ncbi:MAG: histidine phosphotransferase family protein [Rickettsiaceae bacterium]
MRKDLQLIEVLNARILHDLAGAIGAVDNSLSLIDTSTKDISRRAKSLAIEESGDLVKRLNMFRATYSSSDLGEQTSVIYLKKLLKDFLSISKKIKLDLVFEGGMIYLDTLIAKIALCLVMIASEKMHSNGKISFFCGNDNGNVFIKIISDATKHLVTSDDSLKILTDGKNPQVDIQNSRECYINNLCESVGYRVVATNTKDKTLEYNLLKF